MSLTQNLKELISACFTGIWVETHEQFDALQEIAQLCRDQSWNFASWDIDQGLSIETGDGEAQAADPLAAIRSLNGLASTDGTAVLAMKNLHRFISSADIVQAIERQLISGKQNRTILIAIAPSVSIPVELEKLFVTVDHNLPNLSLIHI